MEKIKPEKIEDGLHVYEFDPEEKQTTSGLFVSAGEISEDYDKVDWKELLQDYTQMRNGGAVESTTVGILKYPIMRAGYTITHKDQEKADYCEWVLNNLIDSFGQKEGFKELLTHLFLALDYGCSFFEKIYQNGVLAPGGKITNIIKRLSPFKPETIWEFHYNNEMQFCGIRHERRQADKINTFIDIPIEKLFFYSHNAEYGDPRGRSELRPVRNLYKIKRDILLATARAQQRGAGIPEIKAKKSGLTEAELQKMHTVGRTIGNMKSGYILTDDNMEVILHGLQIQGSPETLLEFINREMFFNTLTEFMTSGIGQNGSRSATSEHKGSYELKCGVVTQALEKKLNALIKEICNISYFGVMEEYPLFKFNALQQTDIVSAAASLSKFYETAILVKQEGDEDFIRGLFNMPPKKLVNGIEVVNPVVPSKSPTTITNVTNEGYSVLDAVKVKDFSKLNYNKKLSAEDQLDFIQKNFDVEGTENLYIQMQQEASEVIQDVTKKYIMYIAKQTDAGKPVELKYDVELANRLNKIYKAGYSFGSAAVNKEIAIAAGKKFDADNPAEGKKVGISQSLIRFSGRLLYNIKTVVEDKLETEWIKSKGPAVEYVIEESFENGFKTDKKTLIQKTADGYLDGRADVLIDNRDKIELYLYNSILDAHLCDNCAALTGAVMTMDELKSVDLITGRGRINSGCEGGLYQCRCNLMVYKLKGDFIT